MTAREKWRRVNGYVRASAKFLDAFLTAMHTPPLSLERFRAHEAHAWERLPPDLRRWLTPP